MNLDIMVLSALSGISMGTCVMLCGTWYYELAGRDLRRMGKTKNLSQDDWLFSGFHETVYHFFFRKDPDGEVLGLDISKYERACRVLHIVPDPKRIIAMRLESLLLMLLCLILAYLSAGISTMVPVIFLFSGFCFVFLLGIYPPARIKKEASDRIRLIADDLPRFVILLEKAMDLPVDQAILITAGKFRSPLSEDLIQGFHEASLGVSGGWQKTLISLAKQYSITEFSSLVLDILNAYNNGSDIREAVTRKGKELEQSQLYSIEEKDSKIRTLVFIPVILFKLIPVTVLLILPMVMSLW